MADVSKFKKLKGRRDELGAPPTLDEASALIELTVGGKQPLTLPNGETRGYLDDGDAVVLRGWCEKAGAARIGFGECRAMVLPARQI